MSKIKNLILIFVFSVFGGIFGSQILWPLFVEKPLFQKYDLNQPIYYITEVKEIKGEKNIEKKLEEYKISKIEDLMQTVVLVKNKITKRTVSGIILTNDGLILAPFDLLDIKNNSILIEGKEYSANLLKFDKQKNLALLKIEEIRLKSVSFSDMGKLTIGKEVYLIGDFFEEKERKFFNQGVVTDFDEQKIQTNIIEGERTKGSALFTKEGEFLGFVSKVEKLKPISAISVKEIKKFLEI
jgi:S1-C subfamily serine protease